MNDSDPGVPVALRDRDPVCFAPHAAVYFQPDGIVRSCCTTAHQLGRIGGPGGSTLGQILGGPRARDHREALDHGDFSLGCWECELAIRTGGRDASLASHFDRFVASPPPAMPKLMDFALSNRCNLQCVMCNGELSSAIRHHRDRLPPLGACYDDAFFDELAAYLPHLERAQFKGGEPFLSPETRRVWDLMLELGVRCEVSVTTNGTVWNDRVERYLRDLRMHAIVSVDGMTAETFEAIRVGAAFAEVWANVDRIDAVTMETGEKMTLSFCLMPQNHQELGAFLRETHRRRCNPNVILVNQPAAHDLTQLPLDRLEAIVAGLEREGKGLREEIDGPHLEEWLRVLTRLRAFLVDPIPLWGTGRDPRNPRLVVPPARLQRADVDLTAARAELEAAADGPALAVTIVDRVIRSVEVPTWAAPMTPEAWIGTDAEALPGRLVGLFGGTPSVEMSSRPDGITDLVATWAPDASGVGRRFRVLVLAVEVPEQHDETVYLVAPLPPP